MARRALGLDTPLGETLGEDLGDSLRTDDGLLFDEVLGLLLGEKLSKPPGDAEGPELGLSDGEAQGDILEAWLGRELWLARHWAKRSAKDWEIRLELTMDCGSAEVLGLVPG